MLLNINMEFVQAFNPLYAVPIVAVIFCALIVYTLGFKSPIQPPSFEGLEEDKKSSKKRKTKEIQKQSKLVSNGKANGITTAKGKVQEIAKKKEVVNSSVIIEKPKSNEKTSADKKVAKKAKSQNEKHHEKKKENVISDELNDDGWVQHVSKKGKKNRKKEDNTTPEIQSNLTQSPRKTIETSDDKEVDKVATTHVEVDNEEKKDVPEEKHTKKSNKKEAPLITSPEDSVKLDIAVEVKSDESYLERDLKQPSTNIPTVSEDVGKSKKKKKKQGTASVVAESNIVTTPPPAQIDPVSHSSDEPLAPPKISEPVIENVPVSMPEDSKTNVVFDELAGMYPEAKEKKKKKVRRDH